MLIPYVSERKLNKLPYTNPLFRRLKAGRTLRRQADRSFVPVRRHDDGQDWTDPPISLPRFLLSRPGL